MSNVSAEWPSIAVCICTFKRPVLLARLLTGMDKQKTNDLFTYRVVVADNDVEQSAQAVVSGFQSTTGMQITYCVEPRQNIALVRNRSLEHADGDFIAFIDDDEVPADDWLLNLFNAHRSHQADGILGPVEPYFDSKPPEWVTKGRFFERTNHSAGYKLNWSECRTGNVLFKRSILAGIDQPFRAEFGTGGEDTDFFRRMVDKGCKFVWSRDAVVFELVPPARCTRGFLLRRALLRGSNFPKQSGNRIKNLTKSVIAVPCYALALPFLLLFGEHVGFKYFVKLCDHGSRLLASVGWSVVQERDA